jgi:hypothetical protein
VGHTNLGLSLIGQLALGIKNLLRGRLDFLLELDPNRRLDQLEVGNFVDETLRDRVRFEELFKTDILFGFPGIDDLGLRLDRFLGEFDPVVGLCRTDDDVPPNQEVEDLGKLLLGNRLAGVVDEVVHVADGVFGAIDRRRNLAGT